MIKGYYRGERSKGMKNFYGVGVRRDADGNPYAMVLTFDGSNDLAVFFKTFVSAKICERKSEAIVLASEFNEAYGAK